MSHIPIPTYAVDVDALVHQVQDLKIENATLRTQLAAAREACDSSHPPQTTGWEPVCACNAPPIPCTVLDPFAGSGTVGQVAEALGRHSILLELAPPYVQMAHARTAQRGLFTHPLPPPVGSGDRGG
jgi:DNA methylase